MKNLNFSLLLTLVFCFSATHSQARDVRTWTNSNGVSIEAELIKEEDGKITIRRVSDERDFEIEIKTLSEADQEWLASQNKSSEIDPYGGIYIAAGNGGHRMSSLDGITWKNVEFIAKPAHDQNDLKAIAVGNGKCVVVGGFSKSNIFTTADGIAWEKNAFNMGVLSGVVFVEGRFLAFGEGGKVGESSDGVEWKIIGDAKLADFQTSEAEKLGVEKIKSNIRKWRHANGTFVGAGDNCIIVTTRDFEKWNFMRPIEPQSRLALETDGKGFVARGERTLHYSADGLEWKDVTPPLEEKIKLNSIVYDGERFILNSRGPEAWESPNGTDWKLVSGQTFPGDIAALRPDLLYSFETYWKYTEDLKISTDGGKSWKSTTLPAPVGVTCMIQAPFPKWAE